MANTNAGSVRLGIKFDGSSIQKGITNALKQSQQVANQEGKKIADNISKSTSKLGDDLAKSTKKGVDDSIKQLSKLDEEINKILNSDKSSKSKAMSIASLYQKDKGMDKSSSIVAAYDLVGRKAKEAGDIVAKSTDKSQKKTNKFFSLFKKKSKEAKTQAADVGGSLSGGIGGALKKLGGLAAGAFAVTKLVDWGKQSIQLASDLQEVQNVVDTSFKSMSYKIEEFADTSIEKFGISELTAKKMASTFMAMGSGIGQGLEQGSDKAVEITGRLADVMSFYNKSAAEVETIGRAIYSAESEPLKNIGIIMNEASLQSYTLSKSYGKLYKDMSDAEKLLVRQEYFLEKSNLAAGDFAKTLDGSWSNQVKVLGENIKVLASSVGSILINVLLPVVKVANVVIKKISEVASAFAELSGKIFGKAQVNTSKATSTMSESFDGITSGAGAASDAIDGVAKTAQEASKKMTFGFDNLNKLEAPDTGSSTPSVDSGLGSSLGSAAEEMKNIEEETTPIEEALDRMIERAKELANIFKTNFFEGLNVTGFNGAIESIKTSIESIKTSFKNIFTDGEVASSFNSFIDSVASALGTLVGVTVGVATSIGNALVTGVSKYLENNEGFLKEKFTNIFNGLSETYEILEQIYKDVGQILADTFNSEEASTLVSDFISVITNPFLELYDFIIEFNNDVTGGVRDFINRYKEEFTQGFKNTFSIVSDILNGAKTIILDLMQILFDSYEKHLKPIFDKLSIKINDLMDNYIIPLGNTFVECWNTIKDNLAIVWEKWLKPFVKWFVDGLVQDIATAIDFVIDVASICAKTIIDVVNYLIQGISLIIDFVVNVFTGDWEGAWNNIKDFFSLWWETVKKIIKNSIDLVKEVVKTFLEDIVLKWQNQWDKIKTYVSDFFSELPYKLGVMLGEFLAKVVKFFLDLPKKIDEFKASLKKKGEEISQSIQTWVQYVIDWIPTKIDEFVDFFRNIDLSEIGKNIIDGLIGGLNQKWTDFTNTIGNFTSGIMDGFANALDINSPSRWMRDFIGGNMVKGLQIGLETNADGVLTTLDNLKNDMSSVMNVPLNAPSLSFVGSSEFDEKDLIANISKEDKSEALLEAQNNKIDTLINIVTLLLQKDTNIYLDDNVLGSSVNSWMNKENRRK